MCLFCQFSRNISWSKIRLYIMPFFNLCPFLRGAFFDQNLKINGKKGTWGVSKSITFIVGILYCSDEYWKLPFPADTYWSQKYNKGAIASRSPAENTWMPFFKSKSVKFSNIRCIFCILSLKNTPTFLKIVCHALHISQNFHFFFQKILYRGSFDFENVD